MAKNHEDLKKLLNQVPGVKEHLTKPSIIKGKEILKRRIELGLTQSDLIREAREIGIILTQSTVSKAESGHEGITNGTFDKIVEALGGIEDLTLQFKESPNGRKLINV
jgi:predicted transcriptional regulator